MILEHHSLRPIVLDPARISPAGRRRHDKPNGLWVSVRGPDDWPSWRARDGWEHPPHTVRVELAADARILVIETFDALLAFGRTHARPGTWRHPVLHGSAIDWDQVAGEWQGIVIAPYRRDALLHPDAEWYGSWDCASGCIWDPTALVLHHDRAPSREQMRIHA